MKRLIPLILLLSLVQNSFAQSDTTYTVKGFVADSINHEMMSFSKIYFLQKSTIIAGTQTDLDGKYVLNNLKKGVYSVKIMTIEYVENVFENILIQNDSLNTITRNFIVNNKSGINEIEQVQIVASNISKKDVARMPVRMTESQVSTTRNFSRIRGARKNTEPIRENYNRINENEFQNANRTPLSTFSIDVDKASYSNIRRFITNRQKPPIDAVRIEEMINYFTYDYKKPIDDEPFSITTAYSECPWNKEHHLAFIGLQGKEIEMEQAVPNNLVFLIDVSGSMQSYDKIELLKSGLLLLVDQLREIDQLSIVVYAGAAGLVLPATSGHFKDKIKDAIQNLAAGGSTAGGAGIELAYKIAKENYIENGNNRIILSTDGDFNVGISGQSELIKLIEQKRNDNIFLSVLGFGTGNIQDGIMEQLADNGNGNYNYIDNIAEAKKVLVDEIGGTLITIAKDVKIQIEFNPSNVKAYKLIGYENRALNDEDFNNDKVDAGDMGAGHSVTAIYEIIPIHSNDTISKIDELKYQKRNKTYRGSNLENELLTIKIRYKNPQDIASKSFDQSIPNQTLQFEDLIADFRFATSVAAFGKVLRNEDFEKDINVKNILEIAESAKGEDKAGYRVEFIEMLKKYQKISY